MGYSNAGGLTKTKQANVLMLKLYHRQMLVSQCSARQFTVVKRIGMHLNITQGYQTFFVYIGTF